MTKNPNDTPSYSLTRDELAVMFERNAARALQARDERQREADWPRDVERVLLGLAGKVQALEAEVATLRSAQG